VSWAGLAVVLVPGLGIAWSPVPLEASLAMLRTDRGRSMGLLFLFGFAAGIAGLSYVALLLAGVADYGPDSSSWRPLGWLQVGLGLALWWLAVRRYLARPGPGEQEQPPQWVGEIDQFTALRAVGVAMPLAATSPKNVIVALVAMIGVAALPIGADGAYVAFVVLACLSLLVVVLVDLPAPRRVAPHLDELRGWLASHNTAIAMSTLLVLGAWVVSRGFEFLAR
jgi:hypothetical protein